MKDLIIASDLPESSVKILSHLGFDVKSLHTNESLPKQIAHHTDLSLFDCGDGTVFIANEVHTIKPILLKMGYTVKVISEHIGHDYPECARMNCVLIGNNLICNSSAVSKDIINHFSKYSDIKIIHVNQGYTRCSVVPVSNNALITDDESIHKACKNNSICSLLVSKGSVNLDGYNYGFIGGTAGKLSENIILFNGDVMTHDDSKRIIDFLNSYCVSSITLSDNALVDIGGIFVFKRRNRNEK